MYGFVFLDNAEWRKSSSQSEPAFISQRTTWCWRCCRRQRRRQAVPNHRQRRTCHQSGQTLHVLGGARVYITDPLDIGAQRRADAVLEPELLLLDVAQRVACTGARLQGGRGVRREAGVSHDEHDNDEAAADGCFIAVAQRAEHVASPSAVRRSDARKMPVAAKRSRTLALTELLALRRVKSSSIALLTHITNRIITFDAFNKITTCLDPYKLFELSFL